MGSVVPETWGRSTACSLGCPPPPSAARILPVFVSGFLWTFRSSNLCPMEGSSKGGGVNTYRPGISLHLPILPSQQLSKQTLSHPLSK